MNKFFDLSGRRIHVKPPAANVARVVEDDGADFWPEIPETVEELADLANELPGE